ncbi:hypothetical protein LSH36_127g10019, partial [Paralvinella palmiformis]
TILVLAGGFQNSDFQSDWFSMESQSSINVVNVEHELRGVAIKVKVMIKPERGHYRDWIFEAGYSQGSTIGRFCIRGSPKIPGNRCLRCLTTCLSRADCIGVIPCQPNVHCIPLDIDTINNMIISGTLGIKVPVMLLDEFDCSL